MMIALAVAVSVGAFSGTFFARGEQRPAPAPLNVGYISDPISEFRTDVDGDGLFDALVLRIPFVVNESGHFSLQAWMTANGASAANFTNLVLSAGTHVVDLVLPGWRIRLTQTDGGSHAWTRHVRGVTRPTSYGNESVVLGGNGLGIAFFFR